MAAVTRWSSESGGRRGAGAGPGRRRRGVALALAAVLALQATGCGTIFYPERKNQGSGSLDPAIVILDGLGLFLFIIPGVIAFAVDFSNDTIYLPGWSDDLVGLGNESSPHSAAPSTDVVVLHVAARRLDLQIVCDAIEAQTGRRFDPDGARFVVTELTSTADVPRALREQCYVARNVDAESGPPRGGGW